ncbi:MAG: hypothetical protein IJI45_10915, partial [Anaerolineaceae bacterium]|nr:hypothetical protein [Anaerolineaceae bacterium]
VPVKKQSDPTPSAEPVSDKNDTVQREPVKAAVPVEKQADAITSAEPVSDTRDTVQREPVKTAAPVESQTDTAPSAEPISETNDTIQREPMKTAVQVEKPTDTAPSAEPVSDTKDTIQREPVKTAAPVENQTDTAPSAEPVSDTKDTVQRESVKTAAPIEKQTDTAPSAEPVADTKDMIQREPVKTAAPVEKQTEAVPSAEPVADTKDIVQREPVKVASPIETRTEAAPSAEPVSDTKDTVQREPVKTAVPVDNQSVNEVPISELSHDVQTTVQREPLKIAESIRANTEQSNLPAVQKQQSVGTVQREILKSAQPVSTSSDVVSSGNVIQRESMPEGEVFQNLHGMTNESVLPFDNSVVQREPNDNLASLLRSLPPHYEMPKEQIEAIRSGTAYTPQNDVVHREIIPLQDTKEQSQNNTSLSEAKIQPVVQREAEFILPKRHSDNSSEKAEQESTIQREISSSQSKKILNSALPMGSFGSSNSSGADSSRQSFGNTPSNYFPGVTNNNVQNSGTVQREFKDKFDSAIDSLFPDSLKSKPASGKSDDDEQNTAPEVTRRDLDMLADKLLPRIKRIMRSEMERSIFR